MRIRVEQHTAARNAMRGARRRPASPGTFPWVRVIVFGMLLAFAMVFT